MRQRLWALTLVVLLAFVATAGAGVAVDEKKVQNTAKVTAAAAEDKAVGVKRFNNLLEKVRVLTERVKVLERRLGIAGDETPSATETRPYGVGEYLAPAEATGRLAWWVDESATRGAGLLRIIPLSSSWFDGLRHPFLRTETGKYDITRLDGTWVANLRAGLEEARKRGVRIVIDIFDEVGLEAQDRQDRHPFNARNNVHADAPTPGIDYSTTDPGRARELKQQVEHALKGDWEGAPQRFQAVLREYVLRLVEAVHGYEDCTILCVGNETESRGVEKVVYVWLDQAGWTGPRCLNGTYLYSGEPGQKLLDDADKLWLFSKSAYLRIHHARLDTLASLIGNLDPVIAKFPHLKLILDSDGVGSGSVRGVNNRPMAEQDAQASVLVRSLAGDHFGGWISKILGDSDSIVVLDALNLAW